MTEPTSRAKNPFAGDGDGVCRCLVICSFPSVNLEGRCRTVKVSDLRFSMTHGRKNGAFHPGLTVTVRARPFWKTETLGSASRKCPLYQGVHR